MMKNKKLVVFGSGNLAELALYYFSSDSNYNVVAFSLDREYIDQAEIFGLPVISFEEIAQKFPPLEHDCFIALSYSKLNSLRKQKYIEAKSLGYNMASYVSSKATILNEGDIGDNCFILEDNTLQPFVKIGNNVTLWSGNHVGHHSVIEDHSFIASHVVISGGVSIGEQCFIGVNATLRDHIKVGARCIIGAGSIILSDTAPEGLYIGTATDRSHIPSSKLRKI